MELQGSHVLITGANRGIGKAVAQMCAEDKAHLHLAIRKNDDALKAELLGLGAASVTIDEVDLGQFESVKTYIEKIKTRDIDILFNNAGQLTGGLLEEQNIENIYSMFQVNINALVQLTHGILPQMLKRKKGKIINHSSVSGIMNIPCASTYSASKAAVLAFTNCLRAELRGTGLSTLVLITPGVETKMYNDIPKMYGSNLDLGFLKGIPPKKYASMIREAILLDLPELRPQGFTGASLLIAQHLPKAFENLILKRFKR